MTEDGRSGYANASATLHHTAGSAAAVVVGSRAGHTQYFAVPLRSEGPPNSQSDRLRLRRMLEHCRSTPASSSMVRNVLRHTTRRPQSQAAQGLLLPAAQGPLWVHTAQSAELLPQQPSAIFTSPLRSQSPSSRPPGFGVSDMRSMSQPVTKRTLPVLVSTTAGSGFWLQVASFAQTAAQPVEVACSLCVQAVGSTIS